MNRLFGPAFAVLAAIALAFLLLPILAIFLHVPPGELVDRARSDAAVDALRVTLRTNLIANVLILVFGTPAAYVLAARRGRSRAFLVTLVELPLVLPPAVAGIGLLAAFGRFGLLGDELDALGIQVGFTQLAVVLAVTFVASPFYVRAAISAFEAVDADLVAAARTVGQKTEASFYTALGRKVAGDGAADKALAEVAKSPVIDLIEVQLARDLLAGPSRFSNGPPPAGVAIP